MRDETGDRVRGGACREQTTAAILHVNGISKGVQRSQRAIIDDVAPTCNLRRYGDLRMYFNSFGNLSRIYYAPVV